jgi:NADH-quinone oxidoreductase subunit G
VALLSGATLSEAFERVRNGQVHTAIVLENDLYRRAPAETVDQFFAAVPHVVSLDSLLNDTAARSEILLPSATFAESEGTLVNSEGRAQRFFKAFIPRGDVQESWRWLCEAGRAAGNSRADSLGTLDQVVAAIANELPHLAGIRSAAPGRDDIGKIAREPNRYSGRTSMLANISVHEPKPPEDLDSPLVFSMESGVQSPPPPLIPFFWQPGWNSIQAANKYQSEVGGPLRGGDPGVRLIEPSAPTATYISSVPGPSHANNSDFQLIPVFHIFGSEELSCHAPGIAELSPRAYAALNPADAAMLGIKPGETVTLSLDRESVSLPAVLRDDLVRGLIAVPAGIPPVAGLIHSLCSTPGVTVATAHATLSTRGAA